jgi:septum formation protein
MSQFNPPRSLVLASSSPRRHDLLSALRIAFSVRPADLDETPHEGEPADVYVGRLAVEKARAVARPGEVVLAADTTVALDGEILGKPLDPDDARAMLSRLVGRPHQVHTGMALVDGTTGVLLEHIVDTTQVVMRHVDTATVDWYVRTGEPLDKAGSYGLQGIGAVLVERIDGNSHTVVGLTMPIVHEWLGRHLGLFRSEPEASPVQGS